LNNYDLVTIIDFKKLKLITNLYRKCNLVHADLNQFNLLWHNNQIWVVDVSQSVEPVHPMGYEFLLRDCDNISKYFTNRKLENVMTAEEIFNKVTGQKFTGEGELFLSQIQRFSKEKRKELEALTKPDEEESNNYSFDYHFKRSQNKETAEAEAQNNDAEDDEDEDSD